MSSAIELSGTKVECGAEPRLDDAAVQQSLQNLSPLWKLDQVSGDGSSLFVLSKKFTCKNWQAAINFINRASEVAERIGHHPDISLTKYRDIELRLVTHSGPTPGLTRLDFLVAKELDAVPVDYGAKWLKENESLMK